MPQSVLGTADLRLPNVHSARDCEAIEVQEYQVHEIQAAEQDETTAALAGL